MRRADVSFAAFFLVWARLQRWTVPDLHWQIVDWLDNERALTRLLMIFRGAAKSTLTAIYRAYRIWQDPTRVAQVWSADDLLAKKFTRDVINVLRRHPWCVGMLTTKPGSQAFWVSGAVDARNPSMAAIGINSNATGSRAGDVDFDDVEVPKNVTTPEARANLRSRLSEATHIAVPGAQFTYVGTPHTEETIYAEEEAAGAATLKIPLFRHSRRFEETTLRREFEADFPIYEDGLYVFAGIGKLARLLVEGVDYQRRGSTVIFAKPPCAVIDLYSGNAWPARFDRRDLEKRRKDTRTLNAWDANYQLLPRRVSETRLDPTRMLAYDVEPHLEWHNRTRVLMLGKVRLVGVSARWDCSLGKVTSDASALAIVFTDQQGRLYWHRAFAATGELEEFAADGRTLIGGQCFQVLEVCAALHVPRIVVETNGVGGFVDGILRKHAKRHGIAVVGEPIGTGKNERILQAFDAPLSSRFLWAHTSVVEGPAIPQMRDWRPDAKKQPDDYLDSAAGAIEATPVRIAQTTGIPQGARPENWRPPGGVHEVTVDLS